MLALTLLTATPAYAAQCAPSAYVLATLVQRWGEHPIRWHHGDAGLIVITSNKDRTTWTAIRIFGEAMACSFTAGTNWSAVEAEILAMDGLPL